jgi:hypothetical protein
MTNYPNQMDKLDLKKTQLQDPASLESGNVEMQEIHLHNGELDVIKIQEGNVVLRKMREAEMWLDRKLKIEGMGAERIPENQRRPPHIINVCISSRKGE